MLDPITSEILKIGLGEASKVIFKRVFDSEWLPRYIKGKSIVEQLLSPDVQSGYIAKHISRAMKIRTIHSSEKDVMLNDIYHPLIVTREGKRIKIDDGFTLHNEEVTNIIGFAGQGKSTILRKILLESIKHGEKIPFFMELRKIESIGIEASFEKTLIELGIDVSKDSLECLLASGHILLLLDGFDEISSALRDKNLQEIVDLNRKYSLQIIVTSRDGTEICTESGIVNCKVSKIKRSDIISIIKKLSNSNEVEEDTLPQIFGMLKNNGTLVETLNSPLLVTLFYICYPHLDSIPNNAIEFYSKLFTTLYFRHDKLKNFRRERKAQISPVEAFECFCALCFKSLFDNQLDFTHNNLIIYTNQSLMMTGLKSCGASNLALDFVDITCLIQKDGYDRYVFLHKSIQEYHAAEYVKSLNLEKKKVFMEAILNDIKKEPKLIPTIRYLYDIDRENTFNIICQQICLEEGLVTYPERKHEFIDDLYENSMKEIEIEIGDKFKVGQHAPDSDEVFSGYVSSVGPFNNSLENALIFSRYYQGERSNAITTVFVDFIIKDEVLKSIFDPNYTIHERTIETTGEKERFIKVADIIDRLGKKGEIISELRNVVDNLYFDIYERNIDLIKSKDDAIKDLFGF
ncbi:NACHT domain-containing protein [Enterobacter kobei]|uniref:NACHT domain-containing protein n=1 Tax=Enterobacter kobei TaxID=208224 RepID=UPI0020756820|nr:NACHT domain-containing protein [Enterobacter kobei]MCM7875122.1 NACHT domain-containing protein [Enterobacter kobei]